MYSVSFVAVLLWFLYAVVNLEKVSGLFFTALINDFFYYVRFKKLGQMVPFSNSFVCLSKQLIIFALYTNLSSTALCCKIFSPTNDTE